ncbi:MAG: sel1 repeat family protein, partial [bacterium]|nr:sel1 repeat family protein [bacterium]
YMAVYAGNIFEKTPIDEVKALAEKGDATAMLEYGERLFQGNGVEENTEEGLKWIIKAGENGKGEAFYDLGVAYMNEMGVKKDFPTAIKYFEKGALLKNADCMTSLGLIYQAGARIDSSLQANPEEAVKWYKQAAELNHLEAIQHLAMMYAMGMGVPKFEAEAIKWFQKGCELGSWEMMWGYGQCFQDGKGVKKDLVQAYALMSASAGFAEHPTQKKGMTEHLEKLAKELSAEQLKAAEKLSNEWKAKVRE